MTDISNFQITKKWPAKNPDHIQFYSLPTPNGIKVSATLEEVGLPYEAHLVNFGTNDQKSPEFVSLNPNGKIPAMIDPDGPGGKPIGLFETGAMMIYLAEKSGKLLSSDPATKYETLQWLMWQMGGLGPMFGQFGFFHKFVGDKCEHPFPVERYRDESIRLLGVLDGHLKSRKYMVADEYSIADIAIWPWISTMTGFYDAADIVGMDNFKAVNDWHARCLDRPASQAAPNIPPRD
ncbi:MAG: glutathione S-transferase N-terminal domain-containing protein [Rhizobiaceae bacterium]|nr:glutathione S-transferase N-terminal domain-containing protein [Rhizobiaceae bacterium]